MKGCLIVRPDCVLEVVKRDGSVIAVHNRCAVTDESGTIGHTVWGEAIQQVANNQCYTIEHVRVKKYNLAERLTTTPSTTITPTQENFLSPTEELLEDLFDAKRIFVEKITFAQNLKRWLSCCKCRRQLTQVASTSEKIVKCRHCFTIQPVNSCSNKASVRIAVRDDD